jgi:hypothetical protein
VVISRLWGSDPAHPQPEAYDELACAIKNDVLIEGVKYINPPKEHFSASATKKPKIDLARSRQGWVEGCSAALPRGHGKNPTRLKRIRIADAVRTAPAQAAGTGGRDLAMGGGAVTKNRPTLLQRSINQSFTNFFFSPYLSISSTVSVYCMPI